MPIFGCRYRKNTSAIVLNMALVIVCLERVWTLLSEISDIPIYDADY